MSAIVTIRKGIQVADEIAEFIANPNPDKPFSNAIGNAGRRLCDGWSASDPWTQLFLAQLTPGGLGGAALLNTVCKPYLDSQGYDAPTVESSFSQGQCAGVSYNISGDSFDPNTGVPNVNNPILYGSRPGPLETVEGHISTGCPAGTTWQPSLSVRTIGDEELGISVRGPGCVAFPTMENLTYTRQDGLPDECGDEILELIPGVNPAPSPEPWPVGEEPGIDPTGQPFFYVPDIDDPFEDIPIGDDPFGPAPGAGSGGDGLPGLADAIGDEAGEVSGGGDGEDIDFGEPPEGRVWIGCIVETSSIGAVGNISGTGPQSTVWPTVRANAALNYGSKKGSNNRINSKFHDLIRPATSLIVTGVFLHAVPGSTAKVFPLSALKCPQNPCEE